MSAAVCTNWVLGLVSVIPGIVHANDRQHFKARELTHAGQQITDFFFFEPELGRVGEGLDLASPAAAGSRAKRLHAVGGGGQDFQETAVAVSLFDFDDLDPGKVSGQGVLDKDSKPVCFADSGTV